MEVEQYCKVFSFLLKSIFITQEENLVFYGKYLIISLVHFAVVSFSDFWYKFKMLICVEINALYVNVIAVNINVLTFIFCCIGSKPLPIVYIPHKYPPKSSLQTLVRVTSYSEGQRSHLISGASMSTRFKLLQDKSFSISHPVDGIQKYMLVKILSC